jgi:hypothetical protein
MNELRIPVSNLSERTKITRIVTNVYGDLCSKADWWWLLRQQSKNTRPKIDSGTVSVTEDSTAITFSTTPTEFSVAASVEGRVLVIPSSTPDSLAVYRIVSHTVGTTAAVLDAEYTGATDTAAAYRCYKTAYTVPTDCAKLLEVRRFGQRQPLEPMGIQDLNYLYQTQQQEGKPLAYSIFEFVTPDDPSSARLLQLWPFPDNAYRIELWYKHLQAGDVTTDLDLPIDYQQALIYGGLARGYPIFLNDLERGAFFQGLFNDVVALMTTQQREYASDKPGIKTDMRSYRQTSSRGRWPGRGLGNYFDVLPNVP